MEGRSIGILYLGDTLYVHHVGITSILDRYIAPDKMTYRFRIIIDIGIKYSLVSSQGFAI